MIRFAQHDMAVIHTDGRNILLICIIGLGRCSEIQFKK
jgi:hypothetical protein